MRIAAGTADAVTAHAERLAGSAMATCTRHRIEPGCAAVLAATRAHPVGRVWIAAQASPACRAPALRVAVATEVLAVVTRGAKPRARARLLGMP